MYSTSPGDLLDYSVLLAQDIVFMGDSCIHCHYDQFVSVFVIFRLYSRSPFKKWKTLSLRHLLEFYEVWLYPFIAKWSQIQILCQNCDNMNITRNIEWKLNSNVFLRTVDIMPKMPHVKCGINWVYTKGRKCSAIFSTRKCLYSCTYDTNFRMP